jgi:WD40 repeat protein
MSSLDEHFSPLVGFFSYSREDDENSNNALSDFRNAVQKELGNQLGRSRGDFRVWQDKFAISHGEDWEKEINQAISQSVFFIPIITPRAVRSPYCAFEFTSFLAHEARLGRGDLIFPILYIPPPEIEDQRWRNNPVLKVVMARQYLDWTDLRSDNLDEPKVRVQIIHFCRSISSALRRPWVSPEEARRREEAARSAPAERQTSDAEAAPRAAETERRDKPKIGPARLTDVDRRGGEPALRAEEEPQVKAPDPAIEGAAETGKPRVDEAALFAAVQQSAGAAVDQVSTRSLGLAQPASLQLSPRTRMIGGAIAAALLVGVLVWFGNRLPWDHTLARGEQSAAATKTAPSVKEVSATLLPPAKAPAAPAVPSLPTAIAATPSPPVNAGAQPTRTADATPGTGSGVTATSAAPPPTWAVCSPSATDNSIPMGGDRLGAKIKIVLPKAQQDIPAVRAIAISPDGKTLVTAGDDAIIRVWNAATLKSINQMTGHSAAIYAVAFSSDGNLLASASWDGTVQIWNAHSFAHLHTFGAADERGQAIRQYGVAFEPVKNPQYVYSTGGDGNVWVWDVQKQALSGKLPSHSGSGDPAVGSLSFAPKSSTKTFATANFDGTIRFFDSGRSQPMFAYPGKALRLAYSPDGTSLASAGADMSGKSLGLILWNSASHEAIKTIAAHRGHVSSVAWSADGARVATGGGYADPSVALWDAQSGRQVPQFNGHTADVDAKDAPNKDVEAVAFHPNQKWLISASEAGKIKIWDVASGVELLSVVAIPGGSDHVAYTPNGCYTGSANAANYVKYVTKYGDQSGTALFVPNGATDFLLPQ